MAFGEVALDFPRGGDRDDVGAGVGLEWRGRREFEFGEVDIVIDVKRLFCYARRTSLVSGTGTHICESMRSMDHWEKDGKLKPCQRGQ